MKMNQEEGNARREGRRAPGWLIQGWGKLRRIYLAYVRRPEAEKLVARRKGRCLQCGACCRLMFVCPFLRSNDSSSYCKKYENRPPVCRYFPMDERDLRDRNISMPGTECGFSFH